LQPLPPLCLTAADDTALRLLRALQSGSAEAAAVVVDPDELMVPEVEAEIKAEADKEVRRPHDQAGQRSNIRAELQMSSRAWLHDSSPFSVAPCAAFAFFYNPAFLC
jgi:hypothetical protein